jgi:hypothetical protein
MRYKRVLLVALALAAAPMAALRATTPVSDLVDRASAYVSGYFREFSTIVAEEHYVQDSHPMPGTDVFGQTTAAQPSAHVELRSDVLLVTPAASSRWLTFRDVFSVNGRDVRDRAFRLARLFLDPPPDFADRVSAIAREGYRYNLGSKDRTLANPMLAAAFLQQEYRERFDFRLAGIDAARGPDVWIVKFKERVRPTILRTADDRNVSSTGRFWIDGASGRVLQTELETSTGDSVMTLWTYDERLRLDVPSEMRDIAWFNGTPITGVATYVNFRRFDVTTDEKFR